MTTTVRVSDETHARLTALSDTTGQRLQAIVDEAVRQYEATEFWRAFAAGYDELASDGDRWTEAQTERDAEGSALVDGVD
jgi:predicted transcriptional regulator